MLRPSGGTLGSLLKARDLARPRFKANPYPFYARLRAEDPVCRLRLSAVFITAWRLAAISLPS